MARPDATGDRGNHHPCRAFYRLIPVLVGGRTEGATSEMRSEFLVFGKPRIEEEDIAEVVATLRSGWIGMGPRTVQFERDFAAYVGAKHAIAVNSCTAALHLALIAAGVGPGDEVITTPLTFAATANVVVHLGATPVFADINRRTQNIDPASV